MKVQRPTAARCGRPAGWPCAASRASPRSRISENTHSTEIGAQLTSSVNARTYARRRRRRFSVGRVVVLNTPPCLVLHVPLVRSVVHPVLGEPRRGAPPHQRRHALRYLVRAPAPLARHRLRPPPSKAWRYEYIQFFQSCSSSIAPQGAHIASTKPAPSTRIGMALLCASQSWTSPPPCGLRGVSADPPVRLFAA